MELIQETNQAINYFCQARDILLKSKEKREINKAKSFLKQAARLGHVGAKYFFYSLIWAQNDAKNKNEALKCCEEAAQMGYAPAQYDYGIHLLYGEGVSQDIFQAICFLERAANQNYELAEIKLISLFNAGRMIKESKFRANYWKNRIDTKHTERILSFDRYVREFQLESLVMNIPKSREIAEQHDEDFSVQIDMQSMSVEKVVELGYFENCIIKINKRNRNLKYDLILKRVLALVKDDFEIDNMLFVVESQQRKRSLQKKIEKQLDNEGISYCSNFHIQTFEEMIRELGKRIEIEEEYQNAYSDINDFETLRSEEQMLLISFWLARRKEMAVKCFEKWEHIFIDTLDAMSQESFMVMWGMMDTCEETGCSYMIFCNQLERDSKQERVCNSMEMSFTYNEFIYRLNEKKHSNLNWIEIS